MGVTTDITRMKTLMKDIRIPHPRLEDAHARLHRLRMVGNGSRRKPQRILPILGPSYSGKSTIVKDFREQIAISERPAAGRHPVLHVTLSAKSTIRGLGADIIDALEQDGLPEEVLADLVGARMARRKGNVGDSLNQTRAMRVATRLLELAGVELLIIDEVHHFVHSDGAKKTAWSVSEELKNFAITGVCPLVVIGVGEARRIISRANNIQFVQRCEPPIIMAPLNNELKDEAQMFTDYADALDKQLRETGIFDRLSDLAAGRNLECLYDVSAGVIGTVSNLVEIAAEIAIARKAASIGPEDLSAATERWAIPFGYVEKNPWRKRPRTLAQMRAVRSSLWAAGSW